ncbi:sigma-54-dependent Fis family transcriptional regulator [Halioglobus maricola]|uniref:Sigma-54-dependent Fis family transcriptional regulator n=1 Tax=Halioglobus maricola TaxID=2601894 RepID=A0A5P9NGR1_9GAMM|nr:sigma 54-interacting transcriptional regulator [Halioglobus maricola]QFU75007.1 sigma-54-dependent Fis family transcriptional regulator [Halioglobus maricola]
MPDTDATESTLPSLDAALPGLRPRNRLIATIVYHPDLTRVGDYALIPRSRAPIILGRETMGFRQVPGGRERYLDEPYLSRRALCIEFTAAGLHLQREPHASRCRVDGAELDGDLLIDQEQLERGVAILLAHCVVLWLAMGQEREAETEALDYGLVGSSSYTQSLRHQLAQVSGTDMDVLLRGATGTGKEVLARAIHASSNRSQRRMVTVNMAAIPASLAPAALFGANRGAYTGADKSRPGYFQQAAGGILFLDEIGDAPAEVQPQLLRALQEREIQAVGGEVTKVELRVISATDADVDNKESGNGFNAALRHRLAALEIVLQPLSAHREDLGELLSYFLQQSFAGQGRERLLTGPENTARKVAGWANFYYECLRCDWPGNIRQLQNACRQVAVASRTALVVPAPLLDMFMQGAARGGPGVSEAPTVEQRLRQIADVTEEEFAKAMHEHECEVRPVARSLNVSRQAVYRKIASDERYRLAADISEDELRDALARCSGDAEKVARQLEISPSGLRARLRQEQALHRGP